MKIQFYFLSHVEKYFSCLQICSEKLFNICFHEKTFFQIFVTKGDTGQYFWEVKAYQQYNFH